jgi:predicted MarR family transcription regulator
MALFIKLSFGVINVACVNKILIKNKRYYIHMMDNNYLSKNIYEICKLKNKTDFNIINYWIKSL